MLGTANSLLEPRWIFTTGWYYASTVEGFAVLARYWHKRDLPPAQIRKVTWLEVVHRYWRGTEHRYLASTEICTGSILVLLRSLLLADTWSRDWGCTMPVPHQPSTRYQLSSRGIAPCLQLARYYAVSKYWRESDFSTWETTLNILLVLLLFDTAHAHTQSPLHSGNHTHPHPHIHTFPNRKYTMYEVCPEIIGPTFISPRWHYSSSSGGWHPSK